MKFRSTYRSLALIFVLITTFSLTAYAFKWPWEKDKNVGFTDTEVVIGSHTDLSGPAASIGVPQKSGMELKVKQINEAGGVHGRKIRLVVEDSGYNPAQAITVTNKMINQDKVFAFVANLGTPTGLATKPIISGKKIPQLMPLSSASAFFDPVDRYSFLGSAPYYDQARVLVNYFVKKGHKRFGVLYQDDEMGAIMLKGINDELTKHGLKLIAKESYKRGATVFSTQVMKLKKADIDFLVLATVVRETVGTLAEAKKLQWDIKMGGMSPAYSAYIPYLASKIGISADGLFATGPLPFVYPDDPNPKSRAFYKDFQEMFGKAPDIFAVYGYLNTSIFIEALRRTGKDLSREKFVDTLESFSYEDDTFTAVPISFSKTDHKGVDQAFILEVQKGRWMLVEGPVSYK
ncbi:MAG: ABC transporter substrate-binding protein [Deltaproteobacteria bacterium]|jgi:branched-chain amino acid transport system substrate-binding protein|nr:ABC transporter substrate-binding protein [Deltaproteobacteria bacterium]MBT4087713.1 ABC transporter substrate-binding protein [Deltaproteobacteria bacterium]MBT4263324.1 ABC transporter substrate-binding protein [Deltaproteobacteria bacterium]MBT4641556.1 ABC transporter substrate-binding protein [Deltaproteobacteria bacterium]MBT6504676.1 ABC transporter substrate-binding protein [Deltaproteobacteria bacterium]